MPVWYTVTMRNDGDEIIFVIQAKKPGEGIASGDEDTVGMNNLRVVQLHRCRKRYSPI